MLQCSSRLQYPGQDRNSRIQLVSNIWATSSSTTRSIEPGCNRMPYHAKRKTRSPHPANTPKAVRPLQRTMQTSQIFSQYVMRPNIASQPVRLKPFALQATCVLLPWNAFDLYQRSTLTMPDSPNCTIHWKMHRASRSGLGCIEAGCGTWMELGARICCDDRVNMRWLLGGIPVDRYYSQKRP